MPSAPAAPAITSASPCPCGSGQTFAACCEPLLKRQRLGATAEQVMRSRFTAHVVGDYEHLHRTYRPTAHQPYTPEPDGENLAWTRLVVHAHEPGAKPDVAYVDFTAYYRAGDAEQAMHEKSEFLCVDGAWLFNRPIRSGPAPLKAAHAKVGRNDPCPCGSGKKYKHCCLAKA